jgi:hypothetical protein
MLTWAMRLTSMPCNSTWGSHCSASSTGSPKFKTPPPHNYNASIVVAFSQGMRDEKMLEKLATHEVKDVFELFNLADKYARAVEGRAWHSQPAPGARKVSKPEADAATQSSGKNKNRKKKKSNNKKPLAGSPTTAAIAAAAGGGHGPLGNKRPCQPSSSDEGGLRCPVHNSRHHSTEACREIKKLAEQFHKQQKQ